MAKSVCPITREEFRAKARPVTVTIGNAQLPADVLPMGHRRGEREQRTARGLVPRASQRAFHDAFFSSTLPPYVLDAVSSQAAIIRTTTGMWLSGGNFFGFGG
mgnify:CR=1 FL=1